MPTVIPPWLAVNPLDFIDAAKAGGALGLDRARIGTDANIAAGRLGLGYAELGQQAAANSARANAAQMAAQSDMQQAMAANALRARDQDLMKAFHDRSLDIDQQKVTQSGAVQALETSNLSNVQTGLAKIFSATGKPRDEINKLIASNPDAARYLTGPQLEVLFGPKVSEPRINVPVKTGDAMTDEFGRGPRISGTISQLTPILGTNMPAAFRPQSETTESVPTVTTQTQFDSLPAGSVYQGSDGKRYRKP